MDKVLMCINYKRIRGVSLIEFIIGIVIASLFIMGSFQIIANVIETSKRFLLQKQVQNIVDSVYFLIQVDALNVKEKCTDQTETCKVLSQYPLVELLPAFQPSSFSDVKITLDKDKFYYHKHAFDLWHLGITSNNQDLYSFSKIVSVSHAGR